MSNTPAREDDLVLENNVIDPFYTMLEDGKVDIYERAEHYGLEPSDMAENMAELRAEGLLVYPDPSDEKSPAQYYYFFRDQYTPAQIEEVKQIIVAAREFGIPYNSYLMAAYLSSILHDRPLNPRKRDQYGNVIDGPKRMHSAKGKTEDE